MQGRGGGGEAGRGHLAWVPRPPPHLLGAKPCPPGPLGAPGLFHRARGEGGGALGLRQPVEHGAGGLRLARSLPGTQGLNMWQSLAWSGSQGDDRVGGG